MADVCAGALALLSSIGVSVWPSVITATAIIISAIIGATMVTRSMSVSRDIARQRATLDMIVKYETDRYYHDAYVSWVKQRNNGSFSDLARSTAPTRQETKEKIASYLNFYETIAVSIKNDTIDREFYNSYWGTSFVNVWTASLPFTNEIMKHRQNSKFLELFEELAEEWANERGMPFTKADRAI